VRCLELSRTGASLSKSNQSCLLSRTRPILLPSPLLFTALQPRTVSPRELARLPYARVYLHTQQHMLRTSALYTIMGSSVLWRAELARPSPFTPLSSCWFFKPYCSLHKPPFFRSKRGPPYRHNVTASGIWEHRLPHI
jgi:hypothetical protein